jgi:hypothetical protein
MMYIGFSEAPEVYSKNEVSSAAEGMEALFHQLYVTV